LIAAAREGFNLSDIWRDFKKFTSKKLFSSIEDNPQESRRSWMLWLFNPAGKDNSNNTNFQVWQQDNRPIALSNNEMVRQRLAYLHNNPVVEGKCEREGEAIIIAGIWDDCRVSVTR
jgi:dipeptidase